MRREAAAAHPDLAKILEQHNSDRLDATHRFAQMLGTRRALREGLTTRQARDILWTINSTEVYDLLVVKRGWTPARYGRWVADTLAAALIAL